MQIELFFCTWHLHTFHKSRLTSSESQGQEETACVRPGNATTGVLFTATNAMKFSSAVTQSSWALPLSYYRVSKFLPFRISRPKMNELGATIVKNQPFQLLWCLFPYLRLKLYHLKSNLIVTRELIPLFYVESFDITFNHIYLIYVFITWLYNYYLMNIKMHIIS